MRNFEVLELSAYTQPEIIETVNKDFVSYGEDNDYFQFLIDRYRGSTTNNSILNGLVKTVHGKGLRATDEDIKPDQYGEMLRILAPGCLKKFITDRMILGMAALQVTKKNGRIVKVSHFPMNTLRAEKADKQGIIKGYYYHPNWKDKKDSDKPKRIDAFGYGKKTGNEMYILKPYSPASFYYSPVDYQGALPYAILEEEIADYLINDTINGFSGTKIVNFNGGRPEEEKQREITSNVHAKLTGTKGHKVLVSFNEDKDSQVEVKDLALNDAPDHYKTLANECRSKLMIGHRIASPLLLGIRDGNSGLGNNGDEIKNATLLFDNYVVKGYQEEILECLSYIFDVNDIHLDLYFETLSPIEFTNTQKIESVGDEDIMEKETGIKQNGSKGAIMSAVEDYFNRLKS